MKAPAVFLDRDGVLVETLVRDNVAYAARSMDEFQIVENAGLEVARLRRAGLMPIVFTNQPDVARGVIAPEMLARMHERLRAAVPVQDILVCPHEGQACECRKPKPGLLLAASDSWAIDLQRSFVVGDRWRDIDAGRSVGCFTILIERPYSACPSADARVRSLREAVDLVLARTAARGMVVGS